MAELLAAAGIPFDPGEGPDGKPAASVALPFLAPAVQAIRERLPDLVVDAQADRIEVRRYDPSLDGIPDHPALQEPWDSLKSRGAQARADLLECIARGNEPVRLRARALLFRFGEERLPDLVGALRAAVERDEGSAALRFLKELEEESRRRIRPWPAEVVALADLLSSPDPRIRNWGVEVASRVRLEAAVEALADLLLDPDPAVAVNADDALCEITGDDLGFDPSLARAEIERMVEKRKRRGGGR